MADSAYSAPFRPFALDQIDAYVVDRLERRKDPPDRMVATGEMLRAALQEKEHPLSVLLDKMREDLGDAALELIDGDLFSDAGVEAARASQAKARTFLHLLDTIKVAIEAADRVTEAGIDKLVDEQPEAVRRAWDA